MRAVASAPPNGPSVPLEDLGETLAAEWCGIYERCGDPYFAMHLGRGETCVASWAPTYEDAAIAGVRAAVAAGTIAYHGERVADCVASLRASDCTTTVLPTAACAAIFEGLVPDGAACVRAEECRSGSHCAISGTCPGTCTPLSAAGAPCEASRCQAGLSCIGGTCGASPEPTGLPCGGSSGAFCPGFGFTCVGDMGGSTPGTCASWEALLDGAVGEGCDAQNDDFCDRDLSCAYAGITGGTATYRCVARVGPGAVCAPAYPDMCPEGQYCELDATGASGTCASLPTAGETCGGRFPDWRCAPGLRCDGSSGSDPGTCDVRLRIGEPCTDSSRCASSMCVAGACAAGSGGCSP